MVPARRQRKAKKEVVTGIRPTIRRGRKLMVSTMSITRTNTRRKRTFTTMIIRRVISRSTRNSTKVTRPARVILRKANIILLDVIIKIMERKEVTIRDTMTTRIKVNRSKKAKSRIIQTTRIIMSKRIQNRIEYTSFIKEMIDRYRIIYCIGDITSRVVVLFIS